MTRVPRRRWRGLCHGALANYLSWVPSRLGWGAPGGRYGLLQAPVTDLGNTAVFTALATGGVLHIIDGALAADPAAVAGWLAGQGIDYLKAVPSHLAARGTGWWSIITGRPRPRSARRPGRCGPRRWAAGRSRPGRRRRTCARSCWIPSCARCPRRSEEHTSELQSLAYLVCRLLLEKKKNQVLTFHSVNQKKTKPP